MLAVVLYLKYLDDRRVVKLVISLVLSFYFAYVSNGPFTVTPCPNCYDDDFCPALQSLEVRLSFFSYISLLLSPKLTKSVFYGLVNGSDWVVLKRKSRRKEEIGYLSVGHSESPENLVFCPGFRNVSWFFDSVGISSTDRRLWLNLETSIEPLLLRYFQSIENRRYPKYLGACGDVIVEEYRGLPLAGYLPSTTFKERALLSVKLLQFARMATFGNPDFVFYFTDISYDNMAVDSCGNVSLVDLDNVILLDRKNRPRSTKETVHRSFIFPDCEYAFSPVDICNHNLSDHNYFSICLLLTDSRQGLLSEVPQAVSERYPELRTLLNECRDPITSSDRIQPGDSLQALLETILNEYNYEY